MYSIHLKCIQHLFSLPFLEILEESVLFDENKQVFVQDMGEDNWMMTITFLLLFFVSLFYGILVTVIKVSETDVAYTEICYSLTRWF
jgi:hypothetical protein